MFRRNMLFPSSKSTNKGGKRRFEMRGFINHKTVLFTVTVPETIIQELNGKDRR
jgi:hypothetical protein